MTDKPYMTLTPGTVANLRALFNASNNTLHVNKLDKRALSRMMLNKPPMAEFTLRGSADDTRIGTQSKVCLTRYGVYIAALIYDVQPLEDGRVFIDLTSAA